MAERKAMSMSLVDRALKCREFGEEADPTRRSEDEFVLYHADNVEAAGFVEHLKLPHCVDFQGELELIRRIHMGEAREAARTARDEELPGSRGMTIHQVPAEANAKPAYNYAYLDEQTKRMIRRAAAQGRRRARLPGAIRLARDAARRVAGAPAASRSPPRSSARATR